MAVCLRLVHAACMCWLGLRSHLGRFWLEVVCGLGRGRDFVVTGR